MRTLFAIVLGISLFLLPSCGGDKTEKTDNNVGPVADTNADKSPGMTQNNPEVDEAQLSEADKQKATGTWVQMQSGELYATLVCKYVDGAIQYSLTKGNDAKPMLEGTADNVNDSYYFEGQDLDCSVQLEFDKEKFTVKMNTAECKKSSMDFNGVYTRK